MFTQIKRDRLLPTLQESFFLAPQPFYGGATTTLENRYEKLEFDDLDEQSVVLPSKAAGSHFCSTTSYPLGYHRRMSKTGLKPVVAEMVTIYTER